MEPESCEGDDAPAVDDSTPEERPPDGDDKSDNDRNAEQGDGQADETRDESAGRVEHDTSTAQQTDGAEDAASGDTAENQEEEVGETSRIVIEISVVFLGGIAHPLEVALLVSERVSE